MKIFRERMLPKVWLSAIAMGVLFLGFAGTTVKASDNQTGGFFGSVAEYLLGTSVGAFLVGDTISFNPSAYSAGEGQGTVAITVVRTGNLTGTTQVNYTVFGGTATGGASCTAGVDYINQTGTLTFADNVSQQTFNLIICQDAVFEGNESFNVNLNNPTNQATLGVADATVTIQDDDAAAVGSFGFEVVSQNPIVLENNPSGAIVLNVRRFGGTAGTVTVNYALGSADPNLPDTAQGGTVCGGGGAVDYIIPSGTLTFVSGDDFEQIIIPICDDGVLEGDEFLTVRLTAASNGGAIIDAGATTNNNRTRITIRDGDANNPGFIQFTSPQFFANEGVGSGGGANTASNVIRIPVIRTVAGGQTPTGAVQVSFTVQNETAVGGAFANGCTAGVDYLIPPTTTVSFANGTGEQIQTQFIDVTICNNDTVAEAFDETFRITLSNPTGNALFGAQVTTQIVIRDDAAGTIQFSPTSYDVTEGSQTTGVPTQVTLTLIRNPGEGGVVSTQTETVNYNFSGFNTTFGAFTTRATGGAACTAGVDFINQSGTITFGPNVTTQFLNVSICPDTAFENDTNFNGRIESFVVSLSLNSANSAIVFPALTTANTQIGTTTTTVPNAAQAVVNITDDDTAQAGVISTATNTGVQATGFNVPESQGVAPGAGGTGANANRILIRAVRNAIQEAATVTATINSGTAVGGSFAAGCVAGVDFLFPSGGQTITLTFAAGSSDGTQNSTATTSSLAVNAANSITICDDTAFENNETFTVTLSNAASASGTASINPGFTTLTVVILDNDAQPGTVNLVQPGPINEGFDAATSTVTPVNGGRTVNLVVSRAGTGNNNGTVSVTLTLASGTAASGPACGAPTVDFVDPGPQTVVIPDQVASVNVPITICNNDDVDGTANESFNETIIATISNATGGAVLGTNSQIVLTIQDDVQGTFQVSSPSPATTSEGVGTQRITITRFGANSNVALSGTASVTYQLGGTAFGANGDCTQGNGVDYLIPTGGNTLTFGTGVTTQVLDIVICDDALIEGNETITVTLAPVGNVVIGNNPYTLTIQDNEAAQTFTAGLATGQAAQVNEGTGANTTVTFNVTPSAGTQAGSSTTFTLGGTATGGAACTAGVDYITPASNTVNFGANSAAAAAVTITVCGDNVVEPNETITLTTGNPASTATITILNDDGQVGNASVAGIRVVEDGTVPGSNPANPAPATSNLTVTVNLTGSTNSNTASVQASTANGTAVGGAACTAGVDYVTATNAPVNFAANATTATFTIQVCNDSIKEANETFFINLSGANNATVNNAQSVVIIVDNDRAYRADFDRDRRTDVSLFRPSNGFFYVLQSINNLFTADQFGTAPGTAGDIPVPGDYDNDSASDLAFFRPSTGTFFIRRSVDNAVLTVPFGTNGDIPVQGDYNGDGQTDLAVFRPSNGTFFFATTLTNPSQNFTAVQFGASGDIPVPGDYDGDFRTDFAVFRSGTFFVQRSTGGFQGVQFGQAGDRPVVGDFDGDGRDDFTVYRPSGVSGVNGSVFFTLQSLTNTVAGVAFGVATDVPAVGDYDGDGTTDVAVFGSRAGIANGAQNFFILRSNTGSSTTTTFGGGAFSRVEFGLATDIPLPARYQPATQ